jgi:hypothetical protein
MVTAAEARDLCIEALKNCESATDSDTRMQHARRALSFAKLARKLGDAEAADDRKSLPPAVFLEALNGILTRISQGVSLEIEEAESGESGDPKPDRTDPGKG